MIPISRLSVFFWLGLFCLLSWFFAEIFLFIGAYFFHGLPADFSIFETLQAPLSGAWPEGESPLYRAFLAQSGAALAALLLWKGVLKQSLSLLVPGKGLLRGLALGFLLASVFGFLTFSMGFLGSGKGESITFASALSQGLALLGLALGEEIVFRGYLQSLFERIGHRAFAMMAAALAYALFRGLGESGFVLSGVDLTLLSLLLSVVVWRQGHLWGAVGLNFALHFILGFIFALPLMGLKFEGLFSLASIGRKGLWTGGDFGPLGALLTALLLATAIIAMLWNSPARPSYGAPSPVDDGR